MSVICLLRIFFSNPGFVTDFIKSEELVDDESGQPRHAIYTIEDYKKRMETKGQAVVANAKPTVKPILIVNVSKNLDDHPMIGLDNYRTWYRYRWCKECQEVKPPRAHHCSLC